MQQPVYAEHLIYSPQRCFDSDMQLKRIYIEMHTADWWLETQAKKYTQACWCANQRVVNPQNGGYTGSLDCHVRWNTSLEFCWQSERVACICDKWQSIFEAPPDALNAQRRIGHTPADSNQQHQYSSEAAEWAAAYIPRGAERGTLAVFHPLTFEQNPCGESCYYNVLCADGNFRRCKPVLAAWVADCPEYSDLHHLERHVCFWCECPKNKLGDYVPPDKEYPRRDHNLYRSLGDANTKEADAELLSCHVHWRFNVFWHISCIVSDLLKPDLLDTMQIGLLHHLQKWIFHFMKTHERLDK